MELFSSMLNFGVKRLARLKLALEMHITLAPECYVYTYCLSVESCEFSFRHATMKIALID